jgi:hypothetical protein
MANLDSAAEPAPRLDKPRLARYGNLARGTTDARSVREGRRVEWPISVHSCGPMRWR